MTREIAYRDYMLIVLLTVFAFSFMDRWALGLVLQDIKLDLGMSDTELGLLSGIAFALFYAVMGVPIARWADRGDRVLIMAVCVALYGAAVALCGFATSFLGLVLIRVAVAIGEAGTIPPAHSMIAEYFSREERPRATARFLLGGGISCVLGFFVAGWINQIWGWRIMFIALGAPGLLLALLIMTTLREQRRGRQASDRAAQDTDQPSLSSTLGLLLSTRSFRHLLLGFSAVYFFGNGIATWQPAFLIRSYGLESGVLGTVLALIYGIGGLFGTWLGGEWAMRSGNQSERRQLQAMALLYCLFGLVSLGTYLSHNIWVTFTLMAVAAIGINAANGPFFATVQTVVPARMRAVAISILYLFANLIGMGLGPLAAGALSDLFAPYTGDESLRYVLVALCPGYFWAAWHIWISASGIEADIERTLESDTEEDPLADAGVEPVPLGAGGREPG